MTRWVECVPNFSEGKRGDVIDSITHAIATSEGAHVLDVSSDAWHNRTVVTFVVPLRSAVEAAFAAIEKSMQLIDINVHSGVHPRIGATDVFPFVPLNGTTMEECIALARELGARVGAGLQVPVFLYERAAARPDRSHLSTLRRGGLDRLSADIVSHPGWAPDFGPRRLHPTFGALAIGARPLLVAYNIYLDGEQNLATARKVVRAVRESDGGLPGLKALPLVVDGQAQVSMNLVDLARVNLQTVFDAVSRAAAQDGVQVTWSEIIGLVPEAALPRGDIGQLRLREFSASRILERRLEEEVPEMMTVASLMEKLGAPTPVPGGGLAAAHAAALAAALVQMVSGIVQRSHSDTNVREEMRLLSEEAEKTGTALIELGNEDALAYAALLEAMKLPRASAADTKLRDAAVHEAVLTAVNVPLRIARAACRTGEMAVICAERSSPSARPDCIVAAMLSDVAARGSLLNVRANITLLKDQAAAAPLEAAAQAVELSMRRMQLPG